jgi:hypothetical protein
MLHLTLRWCPFEKLSLVYSLQYLTCIIIQGLHFIERRCTEVRVVVSHRGRFLLCKGMRSDVKTIEFVVNNTNRPFFFLFFFFFLWLHSPA